MAYLTTVRPLMKFTPTLTWRRLFSVTASNLEKIGLVLGVYKEDKKLTLTSAAEKYNQQTENKLKNNLELAESGLKKGKSVVFWGLEGSTDYDAVAVVNLGKPNKGYNASEGINEDLDVIRAGAAEGCRALKALGFKNISVEDLGDAEASAEGSVLGTWKYQGFKTKKDDPSFFTLAKESAKEKLNDWNRGIIIASSQNIARRLADTPANHMTPTIFAEDVTKIFKDLSVNVQVYDKKWAEQQKMGAFLSVSRGSSEPPIFLELTYKGTDSELNPIVLIGKGVTFDTGGISLKPSANMDEMRADMGGAAALIGTLNAIAQLKVPVYVKVLIPLCENMPSSRATKPGDVVYARNGKSICVDNTDAEGRLILADALCYSETLKPKFILDIATLTGAMRIALGNAATGVFSNDDGLYEKLRIAGSKTGDRVWRLPLWNNYTKHITENPAYDLNNIGKSKGGGSCVAAAFLKEFVPKGKQWLHLDIAGVMGPTDDTPYLTKGMTGRPTRTLVEFLNSFAAK